MMARVVFMAVLLPAALGLGYSLAGREFLLVDGRDPAGRPLRLHADAVAVPAGDKLRVVAQGDGRLLELVLPANAAPAERVVVAAVFEDAAGRHPGSATVDIQECGAFLGGRVVAEAGGFHLDGGLRVRRH